MIQQFANEIFFRFPRIETCYFLAKKTQKTPKKSPISVHMAKFYVSLHPMKQKLSLLLVFCLFAAVALSQARIILPDSSQITTDPDSLDLLPNSILDNNTEQEIDTVNLVLPAATVWRYNPRNGDRYAINMDTLKYNYQQTTLPDGLFLASGFLGPLGSPVVSKIFFDNAERGQFMFHDPYRPYSKHPETHTFHNTRVAYSQLNYQRAGNRQNREDRLKPLITLNLNKKINLAIEGDLINSKGFYNSQAVKHSDWLFSGNYLSDRIEAHVFASTSKNMQFENGGITDDLFILEPDSVGQNFTSNDIPVKFTNTWNKLKTDQIFFSGKYNLGYKKSLSDSLHTELGDFVPVASIIFTSHFTSQNRRFLSYDTTFVDVNGQSIHHIDQFYPNRFYNKAVDDSVTYSSFKNTLALSLREGFKPWVKFGLTGFLEYDIRNYSMVGIESVDGRIKHNENAVTIGGILNKQQGKNLRFNFQADLGVLGANLGEFRVMGMVETAFRLGGKVTTLSAESYIKNIKPKYFEENYQSKYFRWGDRLGDIRRIYIGGKLHVPFTNTTLQLGVENLQNFIYFNRDAQISQHSENLQVLLAQIDQNLRLGILHWNNRAAYQTTGNSEVIPLPKLSLYTNLYLQTLLAKELTLQFGVDAHYHTRYFAPGYEPALLQFYNQREKEIGNYPIATVYANMHLKQARFFIMLYNVASTFWKPREYFSLPNYPVNPFMIKFGISLDLHN